MWKSVEHNHVVLERPDQPGMGSKLFNHRVAPQHRFNLFSIGLNRTRRLVSHERAFGIPTKEHFLPGLVPHQCQGIELTVQRPLLINSAPTRRGIKRGTEVPFALGVFDEINLRAGLIREKRRWNAVCHGFSDFASRKVGTKKTVGFRETATDVAAGTGRPRHELRQSLRHSFGIRCINGH